ncbi:hypothetical protein C8A00DRAFT_43834 [Chaetomidium leptoderma]|uniref:NACHT domain-containing protein n=1 Tax=Chaetomidium leptoderma TaxID=669021 RepID=A0AAN6VKF5_9PEZI|nr:hypothetical protein C8A00DRAFT_43834 [Chaetomidium leptoderma]
MAANSSGKKPWWKKLKVGRRGSAKSKAPDGSPQQGSIRSSADSSQDRVERREKLKRVTELGREHMEQKKTSTTLLGHKIVLQDAVANIAGAVKWAEVFIKEAVKDLPYASIVMAGVSLDEAANQDGFTYVTSQMRYYVAMESLLLPEDMKADLKADLTDRLVGLYGLIISFQVQSVIRFYRSRTKNFFRGTISYDGWETKLQDIKDGDKDFVSKLETAVSGTSLQGLKKLAQEAEHSRKTLDNLFGKMEELVGVSRDHLDTAQKMEQHMLDAETRACLEALQASDPRHDKDRIELDKGGLLQDSYRWVLSHVDFQRWRDDRVDQLLWIRGDPGKGKTMLLCGIIDELLKTTAPTANISFFFCQATDARINNATAVLRGLIYMLVTQQPALISHLRESFDGFGKQRFEGPNAWVALSNIFTSILGDLESARSGETYLLIDALDECTGNPDRLLGLVAQKSSEYPSVKWIVSSRNWPSIERDLDTATQKVRLSLELNEESVSAAVTTYVQAKVEGLAKRNKYSNDTRDAVERYLSANAHGTFLWVALVCQELATAPGWKAQKKLAAFPPGLNAFYRRMMDQICNSEDAVLCKDILAIVSVVYRPITLDELTALVDALDGVSGDYEALAEIVGLCGSFLTLHKRTISFVHQSAKDFLLKQAHDEIFPSGIEDTHRTIFSRSLRAMRETLRRDIYNLGTPVFSIDNVRSPDPDPLAAVRYSCVYWINHLRDCDPKKNANKDLQDGGSIDAFLREKYLHWLEALSLLKRMPDGIASMLELERLFEGHRNVVNSVAWSHDATRLASGSADKTIKIWDPTTGQCISTLEGHSGGVWSLASGSTDNTVKIWDPATGQCVSTLEGHGDYVKSVAWSYDTARLASASDDKTIKIWDPATGQCILTLKGYENDITSVAWSYDTTRLASALGDSTIKIWDLATGQYVSTPEGHKDAVSSIAGSATRLASASAWSATWLASASGDSTVKIWDPATGHLVGDPASVGVSGQHSQDLGSGDRPVCVDTRGP